jgi:hypothetical protein
MDLTNRLQKGSVLKVGNRYLVPEGKKVRRILTPDLVETVVTGLPQQKPIKKEERFIAGGLPRKVIKQERFISKKPVEKPKKKPPINYRDLSKNKAFDKIRPFKSLMVKGLTAKGFDVSSKPLAQVANIFYREVVAKNKGGVIVDKNLDLDNYFWDNFNDTTVNSLVDGIFGYVLNVKDKDKKLGSEGLTKFEQFLANQTNKLESLGKEKAKEEAASTLGNKLLFGKLGIGLIAIVVLYFIMKK